MASSKFLLKGLVTRRAFSTSKNLLNKDVAAHGHGDDGWKMWRNLTLFVAFPVIILANINAFLPPADGHEVKVRPDFVPYEYLRIRTKKFPWGDGTKSLIHNPHVNALPNGYEDEQEGGHKHK